jgi:hypothetical protein
MLRALSLLLLTLACTPSFQSASDVVDLRVLAIRADPPEAQVDLDAGTVDDVTVQVLIADPTATFDATMKGQLCSPTDTLSCAGTFAVQLPPVTHPVGEAFSYSISVPADTLRAALANDKLAGLGGLRVQLQLNVDDGNPAKDVSAEKVLLFSRKDHVPLLDGVMVSVDAVAQPAPLQPGQTLQLSRGHIYGLRPLPHVCGPSGANTCTPGIESYDTVDLAGKTVHLTEQLSYSFFTTKGAELDRDTADEPPLGRTAPPEGLARIDSLMAGSGTLWIVVRDGRGGESWITVPWTSD